MPASPPKNQTPPSNDWRRPAAAVVGLVALFVAMLSAFALPPLHLEPRGVPLAVAGSGQATAQVGERLEKQKPGAFDITKVSNFQQAEDLILDRDVYGAIVVDSDTTTMMIAGAASPAVANVLKTMADQMGEVQGTTVAVKDVVPLPEDDPAGAGLSAGALPLALGGWIGAVVLMSAVPQARQLVAAAFGFSIAGALALTAVLQFGFGSLDGNYLLTSAGAALGIAATAWTILGLRTAFGNAGLALGAVTLILLGNPLSGLNSAPELLPSGWGALGQLLPPGATGTLLRSLGFFDGAGSARSLIVLSCWLVGGLALYAVGLRRNAKKVPADPSAGNEKKPSDDPLPAA